MSDKVISHLSKICKDYNVVGISEVSHHSVDSHEFQFELFKKLKIKNVTMEVLGPFTCLLINAYLSGNLDVSAEDIFKRSYDPGIGTLRYVKYAKENNIKIRFIPTDYHHLYISSETMGLLSKLCSATFMSNLTNDNSIPKLINKSEDIIENEYDKYIYLHLMHRDNFVNGGRLKFWYNNISQILDAYKVNDVHNAVINNTKKLFIVGYHLQLNISLKSGAFGNLLKKYKFISLGMASSYMELIFCDKVFNKKTFNIKKYIKNMNFGKGKYEFKIMNYFDIYSKSKLEEKITDSYKIVDPKITRGFIHNFGVGAMPIVKDKNRYLTYKEIYGITDTININKFDYVIFIPKSTFHYAFYK